MFLAIIYIVCGLAVILWSAAKFIDGASSLAAILRVPQLIIGMFIVGLGTSAPEVVVSIISAIDGNSGLALGNGIGSNIANIALILGVTAIIKPIIVDKKILKTDSLFLLFATVLLIALIFDVGKDYILSRIDCFILILTFSIFLFYSFFKTLKSRKNEISKEEESDSDDPHVQMTLSKSILWIVVGLVLLVLSSKLLVMGAVDIAKLFGVSDIIIGLTIIAIGTSIPELASSIIAALKGNHDLAIGNIIGSNIFNTLIVIGIAGIIKPIEVDEIVVYRDVIFMSILTLSIFVFGYRLKSNTGVISRFNGGIWLLSYLSYTGYLISQLVK